MLTRLSPDTASEASFVAIFTGDCVTRGTRDTTAPPAAAGRCEALGGVLSNFDLSPVLAAAVQELRLVRTAATRSVLATPRPAKVCRGLDASVRSDACKRAVVPHGAMAAARRAMLFDDPSPWELMDQSSSSYGPSCRIAYVLKAPCLHEGQCPDASVRSVTLYRTTRSMHRVEVGRGDEEDLLPPVGASISIRPGVPINRPGQTGEAAQPLYPGCFRGSLQPWSGQHRRIAVLVRC